MLLEKHSNCSTSFASWKVGNLADVCLPGSDLCEIRYTQERKGESTCVGSKGWGVEVLEEQLECKGGEELILFFSLKV